MCRDGRSRRSLGVNASTRVTLTRLGVVREQFTPILRAHPSATVWTVGRVRYQASAPTCCTLIQPLPLPRFSTQNAQCESPISGHDVEESIFQSSGHRLAKRAPVSSVSFKIVTTLPQNVSQCSPLKLTFRLDKSKKKAPALTVLLVDPALVSSKLRTRTVKLAEISKLSPCQSFTSRDDGFRFLQNNGNGKLFNNTRTVGASNSSSCLLRCKASQFRNKSVRVSMLMRPVATPRSPRIARPSTFTKVVARLTVPPDPTRTRPMRVLSSLHAPSLPYMRGQPGTKATDLRRMQELHRPLRQCDDLLVDQGHVLLVRKSRQRYLPSRQLHEYIRPQKARQRLRHRGVLEKRSIIENRGVSRAGTCTTRLEVDRIDIEVNWIRDTSSREHALKM
ncbi:BQ5605_C013g07100 [Microbotryum silenes-dioicae]|uniref:BQ5605_C013g07100 protein n=1 Tax=Microbotryum silenes-dioicae TaxID=796604 RepID=A0A2X0LU99_9BASI|nr:BQ5605_C013g07100 [Microbotryum silenes-dioicae]